MSIFNTIKNGQPFYYGYEPSPNPEWTGPKGLAMMFSSQEKSSKSSGSSSESSSVGVRDVPSLYGDSVIQQQAIQNIENERNKFINKWTGKYKEHGGSYSKFIKKFSEEISKDAYVINSLDAMTSMNEPIMAENQNIYVSYKGKVGEENAMQIAINPDTGMPYFTNISSDGTKVSIVKDNGKTLTHSDIIHSMYERGAGINPNTGQLNTLKTPYVVKNPSEIINNAFATVLAATKATKRDVGTSFAGAEMSPSARAGFGLTNDDIEKINGLIQSVLQDAQNKGQKISYEQASDYAMQKFYSMNPDKGSYNEYIYHRKSSLLDNREQLAAAISNFYTMIKSDANLNSAFNTMFYTYLNENNGMIPAQYLSERTIKEIQNNPSYSKYLINGKKGDIQGIYANLGNLNMKSSTDDVGFPIIEKVMKEAYMNMWLTEQQKMSTQYEIESDMTMFKLGSYGGAGTDNKLPDLSGNYFTNADEGKLEVAGTTKQVVQYQPVDPISGKPIPAHLNAVLGRSHYTVVDTPLYTFKPGSGVDIIEINKLLSKGNVSVKGMFPWFEVPSLVKGKNAVPLILDANHVFSGTNAKIVGILPTAKKMYKPDGQVGVDGSIFYTQPELEKLEKSINQNQKNIETVHGALVMIDNKKDLMKILKRLKVAVYKGFIPYKVPLEKGQVLYPTNANIEDKPLDVYLKETTKRKWKDFKDDIPEKWIENELWPFKKDDDIEIFLGDIEEGEEFKNEDLKKIFKRSYIFEINMPMNRSVIANAKQSKEFYNVATSASLKQLENGK